MGYYLLIAEFAFASMLLAITVRDVLFVESGTFQSKIPMQVLNVTKIMF